VDLYFAKILANDDSRFDGAQFTHFVKSGFTAVELNAYGDMVTDAVASGAIDGITVRHELDANLVACTQEVQKFISEQSCKALVSVKLAGASVAVKRAEDRKLAAMVAQAMILSRLDDRICYVFDTFMDVDRGYYPRQGFIDRRFNPRLPAKTFTMLNSVLASFRGSNQTASSKGFASEFHDAGGDGVIQFSTNEADYVLRTLRAASVRAINAEIDSARKVYDLFDGRLIEPATFCASMDDVDKDELQCLLLER